MSLWVDQVRPRTKPHAVVSGSPALPPFLLSSFPLAPAPNDLSSSVPSLLILLSPSSSHLPFSASERPRRQPCVSILTTLSLLPSLCLAWPGQAGRRRSLHHLVSPIFRLLAIYPPPSPRRRRPTGPSHSRSPRRTYRRSRINQTPSAFGFRPVGRSVNVRVRLPDRSSDDDLAGWSARSDRQTDEERPWQSVNILTRGGWRRQRRPVHLVRRSRRGETSTLIW